MLRFTLLRVYLYVQEYSRLLFWKQNKIDNLGPILDAIDTAARETALGSFRCPFPMKIKGQSRHNQG
jgi:hypothetical protein